MMQPVSVPAGVSAAAPIQGPPPRSAHRDGCVLLAYSEQKKKHYIIVKLSCSTRAQLIRISPESGELKWDQAVGRDTFESESAALKFLQDQSRTEVLAHGKAVLGYTVLGPVALLLLVEAVRVSGVLPGGHQIKTVTQSKWHKITLQQPELDPLTQAATKAELDRGVDKTTSFPVDGAHYYCESLDITRPFPSDRPVSDPSWHFVWNSALSNPFRSVGLDGPNAVCPALLQGMAESRELEDFDGCKFSYCLISRRCRLHVGPRYKARGLNDNADPGNEIECDQVVWKHSSSPEKPLAWSRYTWRRGSVPLWWSVNIRNSGMGEAEIKIHNANTFRGSRRYVRRLQRRYTPNPALEPPPDDGSAAPTPASTGGKEWREQSLQVPVVFFSLLRKGTPDRDRSETKLADAFDYLAGQLRSLHKLPVSYVALDWHQMDKELGSEALVEAFWTQLSALLPPQGFALGTMVKVGPDHNDPDAGQELGAAGAKGSLAGSKSNGGAASRSSGSSSPPQQGYSSAGKGWWVRWFKQQQGVTRYNCADSLDRTNVGSFFGAVQLFVEQCRELDIAIAASSARAASMAQQALLRRQAAAAAVTAAAAGEDGSAAGRPPLGATAGSLAALDKRPATAGAAGSSGFLSSLGKVSTTLMTGVKDMRLSSPRSSPHDLSTELRSSSSPNISLMAREATQRQQQQQQNGQQQRQQQEDQLPPGWEAKYDAVNKRVFYVDHNTKTTTWSRPVWTPAAVEQPAGSGSSPVSAGSSPASAGSQQQQQQQSGWPAGAGGGSGGGQVAGWSSTGSLARKSRPGSSKAGEDGASGADSDSEKAMYEPLTPWCMFNPRLAKVRRFARMVNPAALSAMAELFLMNGDMCAWLYTGSPAMHSEKITLFEAETSRLKKAGAGTYGNSFIAIRRRYNNVVMDEERKMQADIFLGLKQRVYFPTLHLPYRELEGPPPDDYPESDEDAVLQQQLLHEKSGGSFSQAASSGTHDPLGDLTWPLETSKTVSRGASSQLLSIGQGVSSTATAAAVAAASAATTGISSLLAGATRGKSAERRRAMTSSQIGEDGSEVLYVDNNRGHTRSFSSEKIFQDYREQQQLRSVPPQAAAAAVAGAAAVPPAAPAPAAVPPAAAPAAAPGPDPADLSTFDEELQDGTPALTGQRVTLSDPLGVI